MYYPGLFDTSSNPYSALSTSSSPFTKTEGPSPSVDQRTELTSLVDPKMSSPLSTPSLAGSSLTTLGSPFRAGPFSAPHYRSPASATADIMTSAYVSPSATHLSGADNMGSSLLHEQSFLEASTPYGIGPLSPYAHYPAYLNNSVINSTMKAPNGATYSGHNSFYPSSGPPYSALYPETFISEYMTRSHMESVSASQAYGSSSDSGSFTEHLKRLQESFQSKSPKTSESATQPLPRSSAATNAASNSSGGGAIQPVRPEPKMPAVLLRPSPCGAKSPVITYNTQQHYSSANNNEPSTGRINTSTVSTVPTTSASKPSSQTCAASTANSCAHNSTSWCPPSLNLANSSRPKDGSRRKPASHPVKVQPSVCQVEGTTCAKPSDGSSCGASAGDHKNLQSTKKLDKALLHGEEKRVTASKPKNKQAPGKLKRNRSTKCGQSEETGQEKIKKRCKHQLVHPEHDKTKSDKSSKDTCKDCIEETKEEKTKLIKKKSSSVSLPTSNQSAAALKGGKLSSKCPSEESAIARVQAVEATKETKTTLSSELVKESSPGRKPTEGKNKKTSNARRRRFRSGLDMIRSSRKKAPAKGKVTKKEPSKKKDISTVKDLRIESKRLIVNKSLGETLLHRSARNNRMDVVRFCLESEACDVNARDNAGFTSLHEASSRGCLEVARLLLLHGADVNASAIGGIRPLHDAIENNHVECVRLLLSYGAEPNISTYSGSTPLQLCRSKMMLKFLKGFYSDIGTERQRIDSTTLAWKFRNEPPDRANGFDIFADVPSDDEDCEMEFLFSERPTVPPYSLVHNASSPFYLLRDVLKVTELSEGQFVEKHPQMQISKASRSEYEKATLSQLEKRCTPGSDEGVDEEGEVSVIYCDENMDGILKLQRTVIS